MKKYLLPKEGNFYKSNLHIHTNISDGKMSVEEVKNEYQKRGYSIVAFTDHEVMLPHKELNDENFLAITSVEHVIDMPTPTRAFSNLKTMHINLYSPELLNNYSPIFSEIHMWLEHSKQYLTDEMKRANYKRCYSTENINHMLRTANEYGFLVSFNHPVWSLTNYSDYCGLNGFWGVEVFNNTAVNWGQVETVIPFDDLLRQGKRVVPLATDDSHSLQDCFGGFNMIKAKDLSYNSVFDAMKKGDLYASTGPEIYELYIEDGVVHISCSPAMQILLTSDRRYAICKRAEGEPLTGATFDIKNFIEENKEIMSKTNQQPYIRITIKDATGNNAYTRAYFYDEL